MQIFLVILTCFGHVLATQSAGQRHATTFEDFYDLLEDLVVRIVAETAPDACVNSSTEACCDLFFRNAVERLLLSATSSHPEMDRRRIRAIESDMISHRAIWKNEVSTDIWDPTRTTSRPVVVGQTITFRCRLVLDVVQDSSARLGGDPPILDLHPEYFPVLEMPGAADVFLPLTERRVVMLLTTPYLFQLMCIEPVPDVGKRVQTRPISRKVDTIGFCYRKPKRRAKQEISASISQNGYIKCIDSGAMAANLAAAGGSLLVAGLSITSAISKSSSLRSIGII